MQSNDEKNHEKTFSLLNAQWNKLSKEQKTPSYFEQLFTGGFENAAELKAVYLQIEKLIAGQDWEQSEKNKLTQDFIHAIVPELKKDFTPYNVESFLKDVNDYDPSKEYEPTGMKNIIFQHGTFNLIAARPSRGKTTLAVSLLLDAIESESRKKNNTPALFLTFEESNKQIYTRIFNNLLFSEARKAGAVGQIACDLPRKQLWNTLKNLGNKKLLETPEFKERALCVDAVKNNVSKLEKSGRLQVIDFAGKSINAIERLLTFYRDAIVFIDYVQLIRPDPKKTNYTTLDGYNDISKRLVDAAKENNQIIIGAAQLRRFGEGASDSDSPGNLNDTQLKDCGQFEQDANTIIALGRNTEKKDEKHPEHDTGEPLYFWKILKNRDGGGVNKSYLFDTSDKSIAFSFLLSTDTDASFLDSAKKRGGEGGETPPSRRSGKDIVPF